MIKMVDFFNDPFRLTHIRTNSLNVIQWYKKRKRKHQTISHCIRNWWRACTCLCVCYLMRKDYGKYYYWSSNMCVHELLPLPWLVRYSKAFAFLKWKILSSSMRRYIMCVCNHHTHTNRSCMLCVAGMLIFSERVTIVGGN